MFLVEERALQIPTMGEKTNEDSSIRKFYNTFNELEIENYFCLLFFCFLCLMLITFFNESCVTFDNSTIGIGMKFPSLGWDMSYTTSYLRHFKGKQFKCYGLPGPCHFYMTLDHDASRGAFANMHMPYNITNKHVELYYDTQVNFFANGYAGQKGAEFRFKESIYRNYMSFHLSKLQPDTQYQIVLKIIQKKMSKSDHSSANFTVLNYNMPKQVNLPLKFKTLPNGIAAKNINVLFAGNIGTSEHAKEFW